ncbi:MAG: hypothetical protein COU68_00855, partial [Candidatus Pacebacteria bacterium CG10_big_fil_rev_8_21_14_0_10_45_6]
MGFDTSGLLANVISTATAIGVSLLLILILCVFVYMLFQWLKHRNRERYALDFVSLVIRVPKDNEIKIDAAEQMFAGLYSLKKTGFKRFFTVEDSFSFEIVALKESIAFYVSCPKKIRDLVEKQVHGAYPEADIKEVDEINIFNQKGRVSFTSLKLDKSMYFPVKMYKDLPTDGLSLLTSALAKMGEGEGAIVQFLLQPIGNRWHKQGRSYVSSQKKREADPEKATYAHDPKEMEAIGVKTEKPGFRVSIRVVISSPQEQLAESHLNNIAGSFAQYSSAYNGFKRARIYLKHLFMIDFIYRYMPMFNRNTCVLNTEELATIFHLPNKTVLTPHINWLNA